MSRKGDQQTISASILPSFPRIRRQNLDVLYGHSDDVDPIGNHSIAVDKSRMGHVDPHMQNLVDFINQNPKFVTLSSCSGRIVLFHPTASLPNRNIDDSKEEERFDANTNPIEGNVSGKGSTGSWVFVSHDIVEDPMTTIAPFFFPIDAVHSESTDNEQSVECCFPSEEHQVCYFRFEPMLLHVAACNLEAGQFLLQVALQNGLRESGMIVTSQRVTVAFRTHSLALSVPLSFQKDHIFFPKSLEYIVSLTNELNRRLLLNLQLIQKVFTSLQQAFQSLASPAVLSNLTQTPQHQTTIVDATKVKELSISWEPRSHAIPELNLYGHVAIELVLTTKLTQCEDVDVREVLVLGGYGSGPKQMQYPLSQQSQMRSKNIYRLRQEQMSWGKTEPLWNSHWENLDLTTAVTTDVNAKHYDKIEIFSYIADDAIHTFYTGTMEVQRIEWDGRLHTSAVNLTKVLNDVNNCISNTENKTHILMFGGRYGPNKPMNDLILFEYKNSGTTTTANMFIPQDACGTRPSPRWGHTLTALNHPRRTTPCVFDPTIVVPVALLVGGRHTHGNCTDPLYVLSIVPTYTISTEQSQSVENYFFWEKLVTGNEMLYHHLSRCFHTAATIDDMNHVFVFGGLRHPEYLSDCFDLTATNDIDEDDESVLSLLLTLTPYKSNTVLGVNESFHVDVEYINMPKMSHCFAHSAINMILSHERHFIKLRTQRGIILLAGGVSQNRNANPITSEQDVATSTFMNCLHYEVRNDKVVFNEVIVMGKYIGEAIDSGPMIEHCCVSFPRCTMDKISSSPQYDVLFIGGGVSGFAFKELFAPSHHFVFQCNVDSDKLPMSLIASTGVIAPSTTYPKTIEPLGSAIIRNEELLCDVVFVLKKNAKSLKQYLEFSELINKQYRITAIERQGIIQWSQTEPTTPDRMNDVELKDYIAIPIRSKCIDLVRRAMKSDSADAMSLIVGFGQQACLPSTGTYARGNNGAHVL